MIYKLLGDEKSGILNATNKQIDLTGSSFEV